jgi:hypothetical protein
LPAVFKAAFFDEKKPLGGLAPGYSYSGFALAAEGRQIAVKNLP